MTIKIKSIGIDTFRTKVNLKGIGFPSTKSSNLRVRKTLVGSVTRAPDAKTVGFVSTYV